MHKNGDDSNHHASTSSLPVAAQRGSRPTRVHHALLGFEVVHSAGRPVYGSSPPSTSSSHTGTRRHRSYTIFDKERYILANFRFVLRHGRQLTSSDGSIDWMAVEQVLIPVSEPPICPICLECPPRIPRMTRCGHIFCWTCILQLFDPSVSPPPLDGSSSGASPKNRNWRRCPICFEDVHFRQLKSVQFYEASAPKAGLPASFVLLRRHAHHLALQTDKICAGPFERTRHRSPSEIIRDVLAGEQSGLLAMLAEEHHPSDAHRSAIERALTMVEDRTGELSALSDDDSTLAATSSSSESSSPTAKESYYFHQSSNGYPAFLDSLSIKMLRHEFGEYARFPETITAPVLEVDEMTIGADFRRRHRYLSHLPTGLVFSSCLLDLAGIVGGATMAAFDRELELRSQARLRKLRDASHQQSPSLFQAAIAPHASLHEKLYMSEPNLVEVAASADEDDTFFIPQSPQSPPTQPTQPTAFSTWSSAAASANMPLGADDNVNFPSIIAVGRAPEAAAIGSPPVFSYVDTATAQQKEPAKKTPLRFVLVGSSGHRRAR